MAKASKRRKRRLSGRAKPKERKVLQKLVEKVKELVVPTRVHIICQSCYGLKPNQREPVQVEYPHCAIELCCYCGIATHDGYYYRDTELRPSWLCGCKTENDHPRYPHKQIGGLSYNPSYYERLPDGRIVPRDEVHPILLPAKLEGRPLKPPR